MQNLNKQEIIKVHGEDGAKAYVMPPNSSVLLLDDISPLVWLKQTDGAGYPTITPYTIAPYQKEHGLLQDGKVGSATRYALKND